MSTPSLSDSSFRVKGQQNCFDGTDFSHPLNLSCSDLTYRLQSLQGDVQLVKTRPLPQGGMSTYR